MDFRANMRGLLAEAKKGIQYKNMGKICKFFTIIGMLPIYLITFLCIAYYYVIYFFYNIFHTPTKYLHDIITKEKDVVKHGTQVVIYLVAFPTIFFSYCLLCVMSITFCISWFITLIFVYLSTLGGVRWQPYCMEVTYDKEYEYDVKPKKLGRNLFATILIVSLIGFCFIPWYYPYTITKIFAVILLASWFIINPLLFRKTLKTDATEQDNAEETKDNKKINTTQQNSSQEW